jgi:GNAT superfamily N-acetyltransferase
MIRAVQTHELRMSAPAQFRPRWSEESGLDVSRVGTPHPEYACFLHLAVGGPWFWVQRACWTRKLWLDHLAAPGVEIWVGSLDGAPFGYFELNARPDGGILLAYFGLFREFIGCGRGAHLLSAAVRRCWETGAAWIQVYTCSLDHPHALSNYIARGFELRATWVEQRSLPDRAPDFWAQNG